MVSVSNIPFNSTTSVAEQELAFQEFLGNLAVPNPRELVLVNPSMVPVELFDQETAKRGGYYAYPPVGLLYIAAVAKKVRPDLEVKLIDLNLEQLRRIQMDGYTPEFWQELLFEAIKSCGAPHVGVTYMFGTTKGTYVDVSRFIKNNFPDVPVLAGGVQSTYDYQELLEQGLCDIVFRNEGETQYEAFVQRCADPNSDAMPLGTVFRLNGKNYELGAPEKDVPTDWDIRSSYSLLNMAEYNKYGSLGAFSRMVGQDKSFGTVLSNRGCRARCTFCTVRDFNGFGIKQRAVESVLDEIKFLHFEEGIQQIDWLDDDLLWDPKRAVDLFKGLARDVPNLEWTSSNGLIAAAISDEIMYWMAESGLKAFKIGIESGNDKMLHLIKKPTTKPKLREKRELFKKYPDVFVCANFILGFPNETFGEMMDSFNFATELKWDWCQFNICQPLKGTEMFSAFQELGDDRCEEETYEKIFNPGRSAAKGEFESKPLSHGPSLRTGMDVFNLPYDVVPDSQQLKEIWFTFNLVTNFLDNVNYEPGGSPAKLVMWYEAIHSGYPHDASMCAALAKGYKMLANLEMETIYQRKFESILTSSSYWQRRIEEFPELLHLAGVATPPTASGSPDTVVERNWSGGAI